VPPSEYNFYEELENLDPNTKYVYVIRYTTLSQGELSSAIKDFTTLSGPGIGAPVIQVSYSDNSVTQTSANVTVDISGITSTIDNVVLFWKDSDGGETFSKVLFTKPEFSTVFDILSQESFQYTLNGLSPGRTYVISARVDATGFGTITSSVPDQAFTTLAPPFFVDAFASNVTSNSVKIIGTATGVSDELIIRYGLTPNLSQLFNVEPIPAIGESGVLEVDITDLEPGTTYYFEIRDVSGQVYLSDIFITLVESFDPPLVPLTPTSQLPSGPEHLVPDCNTEIHPATTIRTADGKVELKPEDYKVANSEANITGSFKNPCDIKFLFMLIDNIINFLLFSVALPLAAIAFAYAGFILLTAAGDPGKLTTAKAIFKNVLIGLVIALAAWIIVKAILLGLGVSSDFSFLDG